MIKLKDILSELLIAEALPISVAKSYASIEYNPGIKERLISIFNKMAQLPNATTSKRGERVYLPFSSTQGLLTGDSPVKKEVEDALKGTGFTLKDYKKAIVTDKYGREQRLNKVLMKLGKSNLVNKVNGDEARESATKTDFILVFSRHSYDIAGMSTDRGWTSCMNLYRGSNSEFVHYDVKHGSFICYITSPDDTNLSNPSARILIKPYVDVSNKNNVIYSTGRYSDVDAVTALYGTAPDNFATEVEKIISKVQGVSVGVFELDRELYCDAKNRIVSKEIIELLTGERKATTLEEVQNVLFAIGLRLNQVNIREDLTVDVVSGNVWLDSHSGLKTIQRFPIKFGEISGNFSCNGLGLETLEGAPSVVHGSFSCVNNKLTSLKGGPEYACGHNELTSLEGAPKQVYDFHCNGNKLTSLEGGPEKVTNQYSCHHNNLTSLKGAPTTVSDFLCFENNLNSLEGAPQKVEGTFNCEDNKLTTLKGAPKNVGKSFRCSNNGLISLEGAPSKVGGNFDASRNNLTNLKGAPVEVGGNFNLYENELKTIRGSLKKVGGFFDCSDNPIEDLRAEGLVVGGDFICRTHELSQSEIEWAKKNIKLLNGRFNIS